MTGPVALAVPRPRSAAGDLFDRVRIAAPGYVAATALFLAMVPPTLAAYALDERLLDGVPVWLKPLKFQLSLALFFATLALLSLATAPTPRWKRLLDGMAAVAIACALGEIAYIVVQAARGVHSHFNESTPIEAMVYRVMGVAALALTLVAPVLGAAVLRHPAQDLPPLIRRAVAYGLILTFVLGATAGMAMGVVGAHSVGAVAGETGLPVLGWSRTGGDLRVAHFLGIHAMQIVPAGAVVLHAAGLRRGWLAELIAGLFVLLTTWTLVEALAGRPFLPALG